MRVVHTDLPGVLILEPHVFSDSRGFFFESYNEKAIAEAAGLTERFVQDNHSRSIEHVLRGLHYQIKQPQGKLIRVIAGSVLDVAVDIRRSSPSFSRWVGMELSAENRHMAWIPKGFAHGFVVRSDCAEVLYKATDYWAPQYERTIVWNDPDLAIEWDVDGLPMLSGKDSAGVRLRDAEVFA